MESLPGLYISTNSTNGSPTSGEGSAKISVRTINAVSGFSGVGVASCGMLKLNWDVEL